MFSNRWRQELVGTITEEWRGSVSPDAISEAVRLATQAFRDHSEQYAAPELALDRVSD
jgi:hypothetical protein